MSFSALPLVATLLASSSAIHQGALQLVEDGRVLDLHVVALSPAGELFSTNGRQITLHWGDQIRGFVAKSAMDDMPVDNYYHFSLLNKELSYDVDIGAVGCSCNAALFFASMPGYNPDGTIAHGDLNPYYCDGNHVGGVWCWEHDSIEANMFSMATTPHACTGPAGKYIDSCDMGGCRTNSDPNVMCPRSDCEIDTRRPFRLFQAHEAEEGKLLRIRNRVVQENRTYSWSACHDASYLASMTESLKNMTMVFQLWGDRWGRMSWLDGHTDCKGDCDRTGQATFSNIEIRTLPGTRAEEVIYL